MPPARARKAETARSTSPMSAKNAASAAARDARGDRDLVAADPARRPAAAPRLGQLEERSLRALGQADPSRGFPCHLADTGVVPSSELGSVAQQHGNHASTSSGRHSPRELGDHRVDPVVWVPDVRSRDRPREREFVAEGDRCLVRLRDAAEMHQQGGVERVADVVLRQVHVTRERSREHT
jgi:hypothetical protein